MDISSSVTKGKGKFLTHYRGYLLTLGAPNQELQMEFTTCSRGKTAPSSGASFTGSLCQSLTTQCSTWLGLLFCFSLATSVALMSKDLVDAAGFCFSSGIPCTTFLLLQNRQEKEETADLPLPLQAGRLRQAAPLCQFSLAFSLRPSCCGLLRPAA